MQLRVGELRTRLMAAESLTTRAAAAAAAAADDELARLRRDVPQTQVGEGANDALLLALGRGEIDDASSA